jgi:hypothetical protein
MISARRGYIEVGLAASAWGTWSLFFRNAERLGAIPPALEAAIVMSVVAIVTSPLALLDRPMKPRPSRAWLLLAALGVGDALNMLFFFRAMQTCSIAIAVLSHYLAPVFVAVLAPKLLGERRDRMGFFYLAIALAGLTLLLEPWKGIDQNALLGASFGAASAVFYASNVLVMKQLSASFSPREILGWHSIVSALLLFAVVPYDRVSLTLSSASILATGALLLGAVAGLAYLRGLAVIPASHASVLALLEPFVAVGVGALVWNEVPGPAGVVGAVLLLFGAARSIGPSKPSAIEAAAPRP